MTWQTFNPVHPVDMDLFLVFFSPFPGAEFDMLFAFFLERERMTSRGRLTTSTLSDRRRP